MFKRIFATDLSTNWTSTGLLILRVLLGLTMFFHGYEKLSNFSAEASNGFWSNEVNFLGLGGTITLGLVVFAEFFCALFLMVGFATRFSLIVLIICMLYALMVTHKGHCLHYDKQEDGTMKFGGLEESFKYVIGYLGLLFTGPGQFSIDHFLSKK